MSSPRREKVLVCLKLNEVKCNLLFLKTLPLIMVIAEKVCVENDRKIISLDLSLS